MELAWCGCWCVTLSLLSSRTATIWPAGKKVTDHVSMKKAAAGTDVGEGSIIWGQRDIRSHAQKYFARVQREKTGAFVPAKKRVRRDLVTGERKDDTQAVFATTVISNHPVPVAYVAS